MTCKGNNSLGKKEMTEPMDLTGTENDEKDARTYFLCRPIFGQKRLAFSIISGVSDTMSCDDCSVAWHLYMGLVY